MAAGSITVDLLLRTGSFETDTDRASKKLRQFKQEAVDTGLRAATALGAIAGAAAAAFLAIERGAASIGRFKDLGDIIGDTGEAVAGLTTAADVSGASIDQITSASVKLTAALSKTDDEAKGVGAALKGLNLPIAEFKKLSPVAQLEAVAKALGNFRDGSEKTAYAVALFGKSGAELIPFLKELEQQGGRNVILTQQQIDAADAFADSTAKLKSTLTQLGQSVLADLLPPFQVFVDELGKADQALNIFAVAGKAVRVFFETVVVLGSDVIFVFKGIGTEIGGIAAQLAALARGDLKGFSAISDAMKADAAKARAELDKFQDRILNADAFAAAARLGQNSAELARRGRGPAALPQLRALPVQTPAGPKDDPTKKLLDNRLKELEAGARREQEIAQDRNRFLDLFNDQSLLSITSYYEAQRVILEAGTASQVKAYDEQIAALEAFQAKASKATDRADAQGKINDLIEKREALTTRAGAKGIELAIKQTQAEKQLADQIQGVNASVLELQGNFSAAAAIRFDLQNAEFFKRLTAEGNQEALKLLNTLRQATIAQAEFGKATDVYNSILADLGIKEQRIQIGRQLGATTELGALKALGDARLKAVSQLEEQIRVLDQIPAKTPAQIQALEQLRVKLEELAASADPLGDKFRGIFENATADAFTDFITGAKSASEAFKSFSNVVFNEISRMAAQNIAKAIFGGGTSPGGSFIGSIFSSIFGGARAEGGPVDAGTGYLVGERGPEMFVPRTAGSVVPANATKQLMGQRPTTITNNFAITGQADQRTQSQIAAAAGMGVQRALARQT